MTLAPISTSLDVHKGAARACSRETTSKSENGLLKALSFLFPISYRNIWVISSRSFIASKLIIFLATCPALSTPRTGTLNL